MANKAQLIEALSERLGDKKVASEAVDGLVDIIIRTVSKGEKVNITGFGVFEKKARAARWARNPRSGEPVRVKKTNVPAFRAGTTFKDVISGAKKLPKATAVKRAGTASARGAGAATTRTTSRATTTRPTATRTTTRSTTTRTRAAAVATKAAPKPAAKTTTAKKPATRAAASNATAPNATAPSATAAKAAAKKPAATRKKK